MAQAFGPGIAELLTPEQRREFFSVNDSINVHIRSVAAAVEPLQRFYAKLTPDPSFRRQFLEPEKLAETVLAWEGQVVACCQLMHAMAVCIISYGAVTDHVSSTLWSTPLISPTLTGAAAGFGACLAFMMVAVGAGVALAAPAAAGALILSAVTGSSVPVLVTTTQVVYKDLKGINYIHGRKQLLSELHSLEAAVLVDLKRITSDARWEDSINMAREHVEDLIKCLARA